MLGQVGSAALAHPLYVGFHRSFGNFKLVLRAEHDELRAGDRGRDVTGRHVEGVTGFDDLFVGLVAVPVADRQAPGGQIAPVGALAAVAG